MALKEPLPLPIRWTQRVQDVYITAPVVEPVEPHVEIHSDAVKISVRGTEADANVGYAVTVPLFEDIDPGTSQYLVSARSIRVKLRKRLPPGSDRFTFWPRLTRDKQKRVHITVDWDTWKDEEDLVALEEDEVQGKAFAEAMGFRMSNGTTITGGGDPNFIAKLQQEHLQAARERDSASSSDA